MTTSTKTQQLLNPIENNIFNGGGRSVRLVPLNPGIPEPDRQGFEPTFSLFDYVQHVTSDLRLRPKWVLVGENECLLSKTALVTDYYYRFLDIEKNAKGYCDLIEFLGIDRAKCYSTKIGYRVIECQRHKRTYLLPDIVPLGDYSPYVKYASVRASVSRTMRSLKSIGDWDKLICLVLTFPEELRVMHPDTAEAYCMVATDLFFEKLESVGGFGGKLFCNYNLHKWSTQNPHNRHYHNHFFLLDLKIAANGLIRHFDPYLDERRMEGLKRLWAECVNRVVGTKYAKLDVNYKYLKRGEMNRIAHELKYARRRPLVDLAEFYTTFEFDPTIVTKEWVVHLTSYKNPTHVMGEWRKLKHYVNVDVPANEEVCPICGGPARVRKKVYELPSDIAILWISRSHKIRKLMFKNVEGC